MKVIGRYTTDVRYACILTQLSSRLFTYRITVAEKETKLGEGVKKEEDDLRKKKGEKNEEKAEPTRRKEEIRGESWKIIANRSRQYDDKRALNDTRAYTEAVYISSRWSYFQGVVGALTKTSTRRPIFLPDLRVPSTTTTRGTVSSTFHVHPYDSYDANLTDL